MDGSPGCAQCVPLREERDLLASRLRESEHRLRAQGARIAMLERRLACRDERPEAPVGCPRCAQISHGVALMQERMRAQAEENRTLEREVATLTARVETLEKRNAELERKRHRSAAPFRRPPEERTRAPKSAGAPKGHAPHFRGVPPAAPITTESAPLCGCPLCGEPVTDLRRMEQVIVEIPPITPTYTRVVTYSGECAEHGRVRSTHPLQVSGATGAAGVHLGPRARAVAVDLRHTYGVTTRKVCRILGELFGLPLTQGGLCHVLAQTAERLLPDFEVLRQEVKQSPSVHADETSWWLEGQGAWLWVLTNPEATLYHVRRHRNAETLEELLGPRYEGTLVSDCLNVYDRYAAASKSKCVAHHDRAIREARERVGESQFLAGMHRLMGAALKLQRWSDRLPEAVYQRGVESLEERLTKLLAPTYAHREEERVAERFRRRREEIFTFLHDPAVAATNNLAERQLRPAVITRKLSCGNKTQPGARTWEVLASLAATCRQRGQSFAAFVAKRLTLGSGLAAGLPPP